MVRNSGRFVGNQRRQVRDQFPLFTITSGRLLFSDSSVSDTFLSNSHETHSNQPNSTPAGLQRYGSQGVIRDGRLQGEVISRGLCPTLHLEGDAQFAAYLGRPSTCLFQGTDRYAIAGDGPAIPPSPPGDGQIRRYCRESHPNRFSVYLQGRVLNSCQEFSRVINPKGMKCVRVPVETSLEILDF